MSDPDDILAEIVARIVSRKDPERVLLYGSRARGQHTARSDIDIAIIDSGWTREDVALVHDQVEEEVSTPLKIDMVAYHLVSREALRKRILSEGRVIYERAGDQRG